MEVHFYWCNSGTSDKVWGYVTTSETLYNFWGKRGAQLAFQQHPVAKENSFKTKARGKLNKGYREIAEDRIETVWPDFAHEMQNQLLLAKLGENFRYQEA